jgi:enoyl-CoA hydratase
MQLSWLGKVMPDAHQIAQVRSEHVGYILKIIIANPSKRNAIIPEMMEQLSNAFTVLQNDDDLWAGVLCAEGDHFTAGLDMQKFFGPDAKPQTVPEGNVDAFGLKVECNKPITTAVQGLVLTVGIEMMLAGDIVVAAEDARFCQMEAKRGIALLGGAHFRFLSRMGWGNAMYHLMLCDEFDADEAYRFGLVQEVVPLGQQMERAMTLAGLINKNAPLGIQATKISARKFFEAGQKVAIDELPKIRSSIFGTEDAEEGIKSFMARRPAEFKGR